MAKGKKTGGRQVGTPNKADAEIRDNFCTFLHYASPKIVKLWDTLLEENPKQALDAIKDFAEFVLPKLARTDSRLVDGDGNDKEFTITVKREVHNAPSGTEQTDK